MDYIRPHPNPPLSKGRVLLGGWGYPSQTLFELVLVVNCHLSLVSRYRREEHRVCTIVVSSWLFLTLHPYLKLCRARLHTPRISSLLTLLDLPCPPCLPCLPISPITSLDRISVVGHVPDLAKSKQNGLPLLFGKRMVSLLAFALLVMGDH